MVLALLLAGLGTTWAQEPTPTPGDGGGAPRPLAPDDLVHMDFQDVEIPTLVKFVSEITGRNFLLDEKVQGRVSVVSPSKITVAEAYRVFQSVLQVKGFTLVDVGPAVKIIPVKDVKEASLPVGRGTGDSADIFVTRIIPLDFIAADAAASLLQPLVSRDGLISAYVPTNSLIVVDSESNIARLGEVIAEIDVPGQERTVEVIPLHNAFAGELAELLREAIEEDAAGAVRKPPTGVPGVAAKSTTAGGERAVKIVPEERSNAIVVIGSSFEIRQVRDLVARLDVPLPRGAGKIRVHPLKNADAVELVQVLADLLGISVSTPLRQALPGRSVTEGGGRFGRTGGAFGARGEAFGRSVIGGQSAGSLGGLAGRQAPSAAGRIGQEGPASAGTGGLGVQFEGEVRVTADPGTNSLIIAAAPPDYETLREVIARLDVPRRQVMVEALIFELFLNKTKQLGVELQGGVSVDGQAVAFGRTSFRNLNAVTNAIATGDLSGLGNITGLLGALVSDQSIILADGTEVPAGAALISALEADSGINVLSAPTVLTSDNEEAEIVVGQNVPFVTSRATNQTNLENTFSQIDRRDVGITLRLTPQITEGNTVRLFVFQEVSALVETSETQVLQLGPTTSLRSATTTVVVEDGETVAIGGLISDRVTDTEQGVPYLSDIPVLGQLFSFDTKTKEKVNLIILLTPRIVPNADALRMASDDQRWRFRAAARAKGGFAGTAAGGVLPRPHREPAESGGVLLPAMDLAAPMGAS